VDVTGASVDIGLDDRLGGMPEGAWLRDKAHRFDCIMSYPSGKESVTGYAREPWHFRYVGVEVATA